MGVIKLMGQSMCQVINPDIEHSNLMPHLTYKHNTTDDCLSTALLLW